MNKILIILSLVLLASCGPSQGEKEAIAAVTCSIIGETRNMDAAIRVREMNDARVKIGGEPFLGGDYAIKESLEWGLCEELVLGTYDESLQPLKDAKREMERIAAEKQRIADSKSTVKEYFHSNGQLESRTNYQPKSDGGKRHGLDEEYHENGQLRHKRNYKDGKQEGLWEMYYENGQLKYKWNYKDGKRNGLSESYHENGQLMGKGNYKDGNADGLYEVYFKNGQLNFSENYKDGVRIPLN